MAYIKRFFSLIMTGLLLSAFLLPIFTVCSLDDPGQETIAEVERHLNDINTLSYGQVSESVTAFRGMIRSSLESRGLKTHLETEMIAFLDSDASPAGKQFVCEQLSVIGASASVPILIKLLSDENTADMALYALERINDPAAAEALLNALPGAEGKIKIGIIASLGQKKDNKATDLLAELISDPDRQTATAAVAALGRIADLNSATALETAMSITEGDLREDILDAYLSCAIALEKAGNTAEAAEIYGKLFRDETLPRIRAAALNGFVTFNKDEAVDIIVSALQSEDQDLMSAAVSGLRNFPENGNMDRILEVYAELSGMGKIQLLAFFAEKRMISARTLVLNSVGDNDEIVSDEAIRALGAVGNGSDINLLAGIAANPRDRSRETSRQSLYSISGAGVDSNILEKIQGAAPQIRAELIRSLGHRNVLTAANTLLETAADPDKTVRSESIKALALIAEPEHVNQIIQLLIDEKDNNIRNEAEICAAVICRKIPDNENQAKPVMDILPSVEDSDAKSSLLQVLAKIGDDETLPTITGLLKSGNTDYITGVVRALSAWPNAAPANDLFEVISTTGNKTHKILALRGYIDLLKINSDRTDRQSLDLYLKAMEYADDVREKRMVMSGLATLRSMEALETTVGYLDDPELKPEAEVTAVNIVRRLQESDTQRVKEILNRILRMTRNSPLRETINQLLENMK
ncbi:MAG: hypothetical protein GY863_17290 [bacterium]|nr:hypothetical protein [bacterium]